MRQNVGEPLCLARRVVAGQRVLQAAQGRPRWPGRRHEGQVHWRLSLRGRGSLREEVVVAPRPVVLALVICGASESSMSERGPGWGRVERAGRRARQPTGEGNAGHSPFVGLPCRAGTREEAGCKHRSGSLPAHPPQSSMRIQPLVSLPSP